MCGTAQEYTFGWGGMSECRFCKKVKEDELSDNTLQLISQISEFNRLHDFMADDQLDRAMEIVVRLIVNHGDVKPGMLPRLIVELQALSTKFALASVQYATFDAGQARSDKAHKKNVYYSAKEAINKLVDALKISARYGLET